MRTTLKVVGVLAAATFTLTACSNDDTSTDPTANDTSSEAGESSADLEVSEDHNDADVAFATGMMPHHAQAIEMAQLAEDRAESQEVKALAADIEAAQDPEIELLTTMLETWGEEIPDPDSDMGGMDHGAAGDNMDDLDPDMGSMGEGGTPGMMSEDDMAALEVASGAEFDQMFLAMMVEHHEGAIDMAQTEQSDGENPAAIALAADIEAAQTEEVATMEELLGS